MANDSNGFKKHISDSHLNQIAVLRSMSHKAGEVKDAKPFEIDEISKLSGIKDERETQRYLFILEGQKLVSPFPKGDFTSKTWQITPGGISALKTIESSAAA